MENDVTDAHDKATSNTPLIVRTITKMTLTLLTVIVPGEYSKSSLNNDTGYKITNVDPNNTNTQVQRNKEIHSISKLKERNPLLHLFLVGNCGTYDISINYTQTATELILGTEPVQQG